MPWRIRDGRAVCLADQFPLIDTAEVMNGRVRFAGLPSVSLPTPMDWRVDPHGNRSWAMNLHTLRWAGRLVAEYERSGERAYLDRAAELVHDWIRANPRRGGHVSPWAWAEHAIALRAPVLVCLSAHVHTELLSGSLIEHGRILADPARYRPGHNHGLDQDIALVVVACRLGRTRWRDLAISRMTASAELAIDGQGALHEQAPRYALYVHRRMGVALRAIEESGAVIPDGLALRRAALESFIAHATQPDGYLVPIGDSPADQRAPAFAHGPSTVGIFDAGYVFGRSAWNDPRSAYYSIRFGPGRRLHGHEDHLGVTYHAHGRPILVEAGFHSYERTAYVAWTRSPEAHNVPIVADAAFRPGRATALLESSVGPARQSYTLSDRAYGLRRAREIIVSHGPDLLAVRDSVAGPAVLRSRWHFHPSLRVLAQRDGIVILGDVSGDEDRRVTLAQLSEGRLVGGQETEVTTISTGYLRTTEATTVISPAAGRLLTVIVPGPAEPDIALRDGRIIVGLPAGAVELPYR
ncbi:heparinase II/III family protein [Streptosporangiaceae bacterium NEAU-GS5]|nr:heparinase II/III family protein [Streptosporangiaceae bacterium NEAU-GS5]